MRLELLTSPACGHRRQALALLEDVVAALAPGTPIEVIEVATPEEAARRAFPGSPTIRVDGADVVPGVLGTGLG